MREGKTQTPDTGWAVVRKPDLKVHLGTGLAGANVLHVSKERDGGWVWAVVYLYSSQTRVKAGGRLPAVHADTHRELADRLAARFLGRRGDGKAHLPHTQFTQYELGGTWHVRTDDDAGVTYCGKPSGEPAAVMDEPDGPVYRECPPCARGFEADHYGQRPVPRPAL